MYLVLALGIGLVLAWVVVHVMKSQLHSVAFQENAASYVREGSMNLTNSRDLFLYRDVHRTEQAEGKGLRQFRRQLHPHLLQRHHPWRRRRFVLKTFPAR